MNHPIPREQAPTPTHPGQPIQRRDFLKAAAGSLAALLVSGCSKEAVEAFFQKHFHELSPAELKTLIARLERDYQKKWGVDVKISTQGPLPGVLFGYGLDLSRCIGCRRCVYACVKENNSSRNPQIQWIRVLEQEQAKGTDLKDANPYYHPNEVPRAGHFYIPVSCHHCRLAPCTKVCPVKATWIDADGIVVIDYDWCIGCRCCMAACPYGARRFNWGEPSVPAQELNPHMHYLGNRPRQRGVVEKCTFCIQRTRAGRYPACVEICPVGARKFGNLLDPNSEIRNIMERKRVFVLKAELNTQPKFYYFYSL